MSIPITCPNCGQAGNVPDLAAGLPVRCPACKGRFIAEDTPFVQPTNVATMDSPPPVRRKPTGQARPAPFMSNNKQHNYVDIGRTTISTLLVCFGILSLGLGLVLVLFFWIIYPTSVETGYGTRVANYGLMQDQTIGVMVGLACAIIGVTLAIAGTLLWFRKPTG